MKLEARSVPVVWENAAQSTNKILRRIETWTPYRISEGKGHTVHVRPFFTTPVEHFDKEELTLPLPNQDETVRCIRNDFGQYEVGEVGILQIFDDTCTYTSNDGKIVFTAVIPTRDKTDAICTGLAILGASMSNSGFGH
jgi:hypothetical protein